MMGRNRIHHIVKSTPGVASRGLLSSGVLDCLTHKTKKNEKFSKKTIKRFVLAANLVNNEMSRSGLASPDWLSDSSSDSDIPLVRHAGEVLHRSSSLDRGVCISSSPSSPLLQPNQCASSCSPKSPLPAQVGE